jgi:hypothetical protein
MAFSSHKSVNYLRWFPISHVQGSDVPIPNNLSQFIEYHRTIRKVFSDHM